MDFKQNLKLGGSSVESSRDFYSRPEVTVFGFCIYYYAGGNEPTKKYINFVSENLSHDSHFVKSAINELFSEEFLSHIEEASFWADCGNHFRSKELIYYILKEFKQEKNLEKTQMNYFAEYHGKNEVDGNFGVLTRWFKEGEMANQVECIENLISWFRMRALSTGISSDQYIFHHFTPSVRGASYRKLKMKDFKHYLSFMSYQQNFYCCLFSSSSFGDFQMIGVLCEIVKDTRGNRISLKKGLSIIMGPLLENATEMRYGFITT